jgi:hypothetical protein
MKTHKKLVAAAMLIASVIFVQFGVRAELLPDHFKQYCNDMGHSTDAMKRCCTVACDSWNQGKPDNVKTTCTNDCEGSAC